MVIWSFLMGNPTKMDDLGVPILRKPLNYGILKILAFK